jgi:diacylglycerol O-acyltransferase / wax synthase
MRRCIWVRFAVFEGPAPSGEELAGLYAAKLSRARRWRQVVRTAPLHMVPDGRAVRRVAPNAGPPAQPDSWQAQPWPSQSDNLLSGLRDAVTCPLQALTGVPGLIRQQMPAGPDIAAFTGGLARSARRLAVPSASCLNGPIGPGRRWAWTTASLNTVREIRAELGVTVNDIVLAAITRGFCDLLLRRRELTNGLVVRSLVPISIRCADEHGVVTDRLSAALGNLPVAESDPIRRLELVSDQMAHIKSTHQAACPEPHPDARRRAAPLTQHRHPGGISDPSAPRPNGDHQCPRNPVPLYILGRKMLQAHPYVPIADNVKMSVAVLSYLGQLSFGITTESSAAPDLDILAKGIRRGLAELQRQAGRQQPG